MATACERNSGSARNTAATVKFGTKMQANMTQYPVPLSVPRKNRFQSFRVSRFQKTTAQLLKPWNFETCFFWQLASVFHPAQAVLLANVISTERTGLRSSRDRANSAA